MAAALVSTLCVAAGSACAQTGYGQSSGYGQPLYNQPASGRYGGGFIEMLMTGREASPALRASRMDPDAGRGYEQLDPMEDPFADPAPRRRLAALPSAPAEAIVRGEPDPIYRKQAVAYEGREAPGTIVIDTPSKFLYLVQGGGQAIRYGIGVGRPGFAWAGMKTITRKAEWPGWTPPPEMIKRRPDLPRHMEGGPANPLGARAMYLGTSLYRIHGTNEPYTIGQNVSSGCIRMMNEDVIDLYGRVGVGTRVKVI